MSKKKPKDPIKLANSLKAGQLFEMASLLKASRICPAAYTFPGLKVPTRGDYTVIDLVVVIGNECLVAEMKNYKRSLKGEVSQSKWVGETMRKRFYIQNPLKQNAHHCMALSSALMQQGVNMRGLEFKDFVLVPDSCFIDVPDYLLKYVIHISEWDRILKSKGTANTATVRKDLVQQLSKWQGV